MSQVTDSQGNILNAPGPGCGRYTDNNSTTIDWFATHPRPVEELKTPIEVSIGAAGVTTSVLPQTTVTA